MAKPIIKLKNVVISDHVRMFETDQGVLIGNRESTNTLDSDSSSANMWCMYDTLRDQVLFNMYPIADMDGQTYRTTIGTVNRTGTASDFIKQYNADNLDYISICQMDNYGYILSDETIDGLRELSWDNDGGAFVLYDQEVNTFVYPPSAMISLDGTGDDVSGNMVPIYNLSGISYNYIGEVDIGGYYFNYQTGNFYVNTTNTKNNIGSGWDTESLVASASTFDTVSATINKTRSYLKIGTAGNELFLTYKHLKDYESDVATIADGRQFWQTDFEY